MRIALMSSWNDCCGVAVHAWLVGQAWLSMGHELVVFAPLAERIKGRLPLDVQDEPFVHRCWEMNQHGDRFEHELDLFLDPEPFLEEEFDVLFVEKPCSTPLSKLAKLMPYLRSRGPVVAVMHAGIVPKLRSFYQVDWDLATVFDRRFYDLYGHLVRAREVAIVPFPFHPVVEGDRERAREELGLPPDEHLVLAFGVRAKYLWTVMPELAELARREPFRLLLLAKHRDGLEHALAIKDKYDFVEVRCEAPGYARLYTYLHASDALLLHRPAVDYVPVSSTVQLCLGAMRPILCPDNIFFRPYGGAVIRYRGPRELAQMLEQVLQGGDLVGRVLEEARKLVERAPAEEVARTLLDLALRAGEGLCGELLLA